MTLSRSGFQVRGSIFHPAACLLLSLLTGFPAWGQILIDHTCTDLSQVPGTYIQTAKDAFRIWYGHTSHGSQITTGMGILETTTGDPYTFNEDGTGNALAYYDGYGDDLGHNGYLGWVDPTRTQLDSSTNDRNLVMWSWCGGVYDNTVEGIQTYLNAMNQLEVDYPSVTFVYMTGHLPSPGEDDWTNLRNRNNQIRNYCNANGKVLFDFADIESYNPDGVYFFDQGAHDNCDYNGGNWADEWCAAHPGLCPSSELCNNDWEECAHSRCLNCLQKGRAFWWMMARLGGWDGNAGTPVPTSTATETSPPTSTSTPTETEPPPNTPTRTPTGLPSPTFTHTGVVTATPTPTEESADTPTSTPTGDTTPSPTRTPVEGGDLSLSTILEGCQYLDDGDIPADSFLPPATAVYVANAASGGSDSNSGTSIDQPFERLTTAIQYANDNYWIPMTIYLRAGVHIFKASDDSLWTNIGRGNLYITAYQNEDAIVRPFYWPGNPGVTEDPSSEERAFLVWGSYENITFDNFTIEGWSLPFLFGSDYGASPMRNVTIKNVTATNFTKRDGNPDFLTTFLETGYLENGSVPSFDNPESASYQIENLILSNVTIEGVDIGINVGDEDDANVKGMRLSRVNIINPTAASGDSASDAVAIVNSYKVLVDHCRIINPDDDGLDFKSWDVSVVNSWMQGTGRNAVKFWHNGEVINSILYDVTDINDGAIVVRTGPFRFINSVLLHAPNGYSGTFDYDEPGSTNLLEIVNSAFGEVKGFYSGTSNLRVMNNRYFDLVDNPDLFEGDVSAQNTGELNALPNCSGNAMASNPFADPAAGDFSLTPGCDWIDAGVSSGVLLPSFDYYGNPRVNGSEVDIGPIESGSAPSVEGDTNGDATVDNLDLFFFSGNWNHIPDTQNAGCNAVLDGDINSKDLLSLLKAWRDQM
jgi:hypothetical protein